MASSARARGGLSTPDLVVGTGVALGMGVAFTLLSSGWSLLVTFVPGIIGAWLVFGWLSLKRAPLPHGSSFIPIYFATLAVQFLHFAEEYATGFRVAFPALYGGAPYADQLFVTFNMLSYTIFTLACLVVFSGRLRFLLIPVLFFIIYGAIGNAISHTWWSLWLGAYFPGLVTAQAYWLLGPLVLSRLVGSRRAALTITALFALVLVPMLTIFAAPGAR